MTCQNWYIQYIWITLNSGFASNSSLLAKTREQQNLKDYFKCDIWATSQHYQMPTAFTQLLKVTSTMVGRHSSSGLYAIHPGCLMILTTEHLSDGKIEKSFLYYLSQQTVEPPFRHSQKSNMWIGIGEAHFLQESMVVPLLPTSGEDRTNPHSSFPPSPHLNLWIQHWQG